MPSAAFRQKLECCFSCRLAGISWTASDGKISTAIEGHTFESSALIATDRESFQQGKVNPPVRRNSGISCICLSRS